MKAHLIIDYFSNAPESHRLGLLIISIALVWSLENIQHWKFNYSRWKHAFTNAKFILTDGCVQVFMGIILLKELNWIGLHNWGLVRYIPFTGNPLIHFIIIFLLLDLLEYVYHLLEITFHF
jgi:sterol desaturase/sphingolipid hydroxylase (fatty acid hydroxylase superfamily)